MKYRSELAEILEEIDKVRSALTDLVMAIDRPTSDPWYEYGERWERVGNSLASTLESAARNDDELRQILYSRAVSGIAARSNHTPDLPSDIAPPPPKPAVSPKVQKAIDYIRSKGPVKALSIARHIGLKGDAGFRKHYVPKLKALGVKNDGNGYYLPPDA
jgi:hypothetical protein